jgi:predicted acyl esterase
MYGTSYSGFNSLQVAAERPPALKAVVAIYASDDRYTDDVHYTGGAAKLLDLVDYPLYMVALNALPPVPAVAGPRWRERWRGAGRRPGAVAAAVARGAGRRAVLAPGVAAAGYERIACPTMLVAGWADGYRNATFRVLERLQAPAGCCSVLEPHGHRPLPARAADRPGPGDGPLVGPLAARDRPTASTRTRR